MRELRLSYLFLSTVFILFSFSAAWPWPPFDGLMVKRQDGGSNSKAASPTSTSNSNPASSNPSNTDSSSSDTITSKPTPTNSNSGSNSDSQSSGSESPTNSSSNDNEDSSPNSTSTIEIDPRLPAGGVQMITPAPTSGAQYYKIGDKITFGWNYTSLSVTPKAIDIMASCTENHKLYTIAQNRSVGSSEAVTWDTKPEVTADIPLVMATYTLLIYDNEKGISATPSPGYLGRYDQFTFGMYIPKQYTPAPAFQCASCSRASSQQANLERQALAFMFGMVIITITSFTWFVSGVLF